MGFSTQKIYTYLFLFVSLFTTGAFLYPVAKIVQVTTGVPIETSIIVLGVLILIYTAVGGLWAVIVTDVLQFVVLTAAVLIVVPLSFHEIGGVSTFINEAPDNFFNFVNSEYTPAFMIAFGLYNLFFIAGNWAYVQRYTSVSTPRNAKKVGLLFGGLYSLSPIIWMLPPMIYRVLNPELDGLADEGAYLLMCKQVLPAGMLGLMLGGMIFATSSSVNTTLNISAGVITNDIFKHFRPDSSSQKLIRVARGATVILGVLTILIALMVPMFGGIVEVVLSIAALTGGAMFLPPLWSLFSKNQTGRSALFVTITSLTINAFFKFLAPGLLELTLSRTLEMIIGVGIPILLLILTEIYFKLTQMKPEQFEKYELLTNGTADILNDVESTEGNKKGGRVIAIGIASTGVLIQLLSAFADYGSLLIAGLGALVLIIGGIIYWKNR